MKTRSALLALSLLIPAAAQAQAVTHVQILPPKASPNGDNVVVIAINDVRLPATLPGQCLAKGVVTQVVLGTQFHAGQSLAIKVACGHGTPIIDDRPATRDGGNASVDAMVLSRTTKAIVHLDDTGAVIWREAPLPRLPQYGSVYGFSVLNGAALPLSRAVG
jgi:hypothetical protein